MEMKFTAPPLMSGDVSKCRVFIPCRTHKIDISDLRRFAPTIITVSERYAVYPDQPVVTNAVAFTHAFLVDAGFDPKRDYVALGGDALLSAILMMTLGRYYTDVTILRYDVQAGAYWPSTFS